MKCILIAAFLAGILATGCSNRQVYDSLQAQQRSRCARVPAVQYEECMAGAGGSYEEYQRARTESRDDDTR